MKTVFDTRQCAHIWAQQSQPHGRNPGNSVHFDGAVIYSYATPVAAFIPTARKPRTKEPIYGAVLVTSHTYSVTTSGKHMPAVRRAIRGDVPVFSVPDIGHSGGRARSAATWPASDPKSYAQTHKNNLAWLLEQYRAVVAREMRAVCWYPSAADVLARPWNEVLAYASTFGVKLLKRDTPDVAGDAAKIEARRARLDAARNDPKYSGKRKFQEQRRLAGLKDAERMEEWRKGANIYAPSSEFAALRYNADRGEFETSQGARVPLVDARRFYVLYTSALRHGGWLPTPAPTGQFSVGSFPLREIEANGDVRIGCHRIKASEIAAFGELLAGGAA